MRSWLSIAILIVSLSARADTPKPVKVELVKPEPLHGKALQAYTEDLRKGRGLQGKHKYKAAIAAFEDALQIAPDEPEALGELGWTAYLAKDLAKAEAMTRKAAARQGAPNIRGAVLYNLGKIEEDLGHKPAAIAAYTDSLRVRPNGVVRAALARLDERAAHVFDPFALQKLAGPYASFDNYCSTASDTEIDPMDPDGKAVLSCTCRGSVAKNAKPTAPYQAVGLIAHECLPDDNIGGFQDNSLAIEIGGKWYVAPLPRTDYIRRCSIDHSIASVNVADVTNGKGPEMLVHYADIGSCSSDIEIAGWDTHSLVVAGLAANGTPYATRAITIINRETYDDPPTDPHPKSTTPVDVALELAWAKDGSVQVTGKTKGLDSSEASNLIGKHTITFP